MRNETSRSWPRLAWIFLTNSLVLFLVFRGIEKERELRSLLVASGQQIGFWNLLQTQPWNLVFVGLMVLGILLELLKNTLSAVINIEFYLVCGLYALLQLAIHSPQFYGDSHALQSIVFYILPGLIVFM